jgi:DNA-binding response OmpR family regulator
MQEHYRVLVVGRRPEAVDGVTKTLETNAYVVTSTVIDNVAIDIAGSSELDALVIGEGVPSSDRGYLVRQVRDRQPDIAVVVAHGPHSVLTQLRQAFKERDSERAG